MEANITTNIVFQEEGQAMTNSLIVAREFNKEHRHVLDAIRKLIAGSAENPAYPQDMFREDFYTNAQNGQQYPFYLMNRDGFTLLAMGFTGDRAREFKLKFLQAFNAMGQLLSSDEYILMRSQQIMKRLNDQLNQKIQMLEDKNAILSHENAVQQALLEEQKPKVVFADAIVGGKTNILIRDLAKIIQQNGYEIGEKRLFIWLRENKYLTISNMPMQRYVEMGLFFVDEGSHSESGLMKCHFTTKVTPKGQQYFVNKFLGEN